jgi:hypothetical protein
MKRLIILAVTWLIVTEAAFAQGVQTGILRGTVKDQQDRAVPGATVTTTSPALLGPRETVSDAQGNYALRALPPGDYDVVVELSGFTTITFKAAVPLGLTVDQDVTLRAAGVTETVQVFAEASAPIATPVVGINLKQAEIESLATPRTLQGIAQLSPALTENSPNANQVVINGAFAFDSAFLVNGVDVNDNVLAQPQSLFIEDAIEETQVLTSGISAEYGRFSGGVINAITKSGGNTFSGSGRINFSNPGWTTETPFEASRPVPIVHTDDLQETWEGVFGGPLVRDRLWFFAAGRYAALDIPRTLATTAAQVVQHDLNKRGQIKLTGVVAPNHTIQGDYVNNARTTTNSSGALGLIIDPNALSTISTPNRYYSGNYRGVLTSSLLLEAQFSGRRNELIGGGTGSDLATNSPFIVTTFNAIYNAPYFDGIDAEQRNNRQLTGSATKFWQGGGSHETKGGYEWYRSQRTGGGSQSPTGYVFVSNFLTGAGNAPVLDATGRPTPVFTPGVSKLEYFPAIKGAVLNNDSNSLYVADHWVLGSHLSADLGARFEHVTAKSTGGIVSIRNNRIVPRLALAYDVQGDGDKIVHVTYGQYSGRYNEAQIGRNSPVGNSPLIESVYRGPAGQGYGFAAGLNPANYPISSANATVTDATQNVFMTPGTKSPLTHEFSLSFGENLFNGRGYSEVTYVARVTHNLLDDFLTRQGGSTNAIVNGISAGTFTNVVFQNTDEANRQYQGLVFQSRFRISNAWNVNGHYTLQIRNHGNYEGEGTNQPGNKSFIGDYPEAFNAARNFPDGRLQDFQRSRLRIWSVYNQGLGAAGDLSFSGLWRLDSGRVFSLAARNQPLTSTQTALISAAGYPDTPGTGPVSGNQVFFGERGSETFPGHGLFDTSINYNIPVFRTLRPWLKFDVYNLFNNQKLIAWNTVITQNAASPKDNLGLATDYTKSATYDTATGNTVINLYTTTINTYPLAFGGAIPGGRTFRLAMGFRF